MFLPIPSLLSLFLFAAFPSGVYGEGFLKHDPRAKLQFRNRDTQFRQAMEAIAGCRGPVTDEGHSQLSEVKRVLAPMWQVLPKNDHGRVEWKMLRYIAHRYFLQRSHLLIRGLEPVRKVNESDIGAAQILTNSAPSLVESVLEDKRSSEGFTLDDAVSLVATLEQVTYDSEGQLLQTVFQRTEKFSAPSIRVGELQELIVVYMVHWLIGDDQEVIEMLLENRTQLEEEIPHWNAIKGMINGLVNGMVYARNRAPKIGHGKVLMENMYDFNDAHEIVATITKSFGSYWESECQGIKRSLEALDTTGTGRVRLVDFYGANSDGEWRFGESEAYLRELGALDETSSWRGKQVIIPNYLQGASNCIVTTQHYFVCCANECEVVLNEIEAAVKASVATPEEILEPITRLTSFDDDAPMLSSALKAQLSRIADTHGGQVPLHGRLFAQWLHYVFPRECPFPHKTGAHSTQSPLEYGDSFAASESEVSNHASRRHASVPSQNAEQEEAQWMSQWSEEEELFADYSAQLRAPWDATGNLKRVAFAAAALVGLGSLAITIKNQGSSKHDFDSFGKAHFV